MNQTASSNQKGPFHKVVKKIVSGLDQTIAKAFFEHRDKNGLRGLEKIVVDELIVQFEKQRFAVAKEAPRQDWEIKGTYQWTEGRERIDFVLTCPRGKHIGIEAKVCSLPRLTHQSPKQSLYDLGQISKDHLQLQSTKLDDAYCIVAVHGDAVDIKSQVFRRFHNQLFVDFTNSMVRGELKMESNKMSKQLQIESCRELGLHLPFEKIRASDFCQFIAPGFAIVGLWAGPMRLRRSTRRASV